jgi:hypothetical protein
MSAKLKSAKSGWFSRLALGALRLELFNALRLAITRPMRQIIVPAATVFLPAFTQSLRA